MKGTLHGHVYIRIISNLSGKYQNDTVGHNGIESITWPMGHTVDKKKTLPINHLNRKILADRRIVTKHSSINSLGLDKTQLVTWFTRKKSEGLNEQLGL